MKLTAHIILTCCLLITGCHKESRYVVLEMEDSTFAISAQIIPSPQPFTNSKAKVRGHLTVRNKTLLPQEFGNRFLFLETADSKVRRTYLDTLESRDIDFSTVTINGSDSLVIDVFWVFKRADKLSFQKLNFDRKGLEQFLLAKKR